MNRQILTCNAKKSKTYFKQHKFVHYRNIFEYYKKSIMFGFVKSHSTFESTFLNNLNRWLCIGCYSMAIIATEPDNFKNGWRSMYLHTWGKIADVSWRSKILDYSGKTSLFSHTLSVNEVITRLLDCQK